MTKGATLTVLAIVGGFAFGVLWGQGARRAAPGHTTTKFNDGVLTVETNVYGTLSDGLLGLLR